MTTFPFYVTEDGKMPVGARETYIRLLKELAGKKVTISIKEAKEKRSLDQNAYYWAAIVPHVRKVRLEAGDPVTIEQCHEDLLSEFAGRVECHTLHGEVYSRPMRSKEMNVSQMADYITAITAAMSAFGAPVPIQNEY
jgi:NinB protein